MSEPRHRQYGGAVALWRTIHVQVDAPPHVLEDEIGLRLVAPEDGWRHRPDMSASGTPFLSFFTPSEMLALAREAGFKDVQHVSASTLAQRYFADRADGLRPPKNGEELLVATTG